MTDDKHYSEIDLPFYQAEVASILPPAILDFHAHAWSCDDWKFKPWEADAPGGKYMVTAERYPVDQLLSDGRRCFFGKEYNAVVFGYPTPVSDWQKDCEFIAAAGKRKGLYPFMLAGRNFSPPREQILQAIDEGNFLGFKVLLDWFGDDYGDVRIEDMLGETEMTIANERKMVVLLHVPRSERLADPDIQAGVQRLAKEYPDASIVLAHCGRCYLPSELRRAIGSIGDLPNVYMDTSMVMDAGTIQIAMNEIGPERLLYGSDFPVAAMRGRRVRVMDHWVDVVLDEYSDSAFRVKSDDIRATFMAVEIAVAVRDAALLAGISDADLRGIFHDNGIGLLEKVANGEGLSRLRANWTD